MEGLIRRARVVRGSMRLRLSVAERSYRPHATKARLCAVPVDHPMDSLLLLLRGEVSEGSQGKCADHPPFDRVSKSQNSLSGSWS